jgi:hypothetical protein
MPTNPFNIGLGIRKYQPDNQPVKVCNEMILPGCDCCRIGPCKLCLKWTVDGVEKNGKASGDGELWQGGAGGIDFKAYWDETYCTINVELNGELVWVRGLCEGYGGDEVTCRDWSGSVEYQLYGGAAGIFEWKVTEYLQLKRRNGDPPEDSCRVDVLVVFDSQEANRPAVQDIQNGALQPLVDLLEAYSGSYQMGLVTFRTAGDRRATPDLLFALNNGAAFLAAVDSINVSGNNVVPPDNVRPSFAAMTLAQSQNWRPSAHKICILVNQGTPDTENILQYQVTSSMAISGITTNAITTPYWSAPGPSPTHAFNSDSQEVNGKTAQLGGGSHSSVISDGTFDYNGGVAPLADAIKGLVGGACDPPGGRHCFARSFCGDCDCAPEELCVTLLSDIHSCVGIIPFSGERCPDNTVIGPSWEGDLECNPGDDSIHITLSLGRNDYNDSCVISGTATGTIGGVAISIDLTPKEVGGDCKGLSGSWTQEIEGTPYTVSVRPLDCGECSGILTDCCPDIPINETLFVDFIQIAKGVDIILPPPSPPALGDDCECAAVTVPVYGGALIGLGNDEGIWYSELMGWPCPAYPSGPTNWRVVLACSAGVFTLGVEWYDNCIALAKPGSPVFCNPLGSTSMTQTGILECDPLEIEFRPDTPGTLFLSGICEGNIQPAHMMAIVTE